MFRIVRFLARTLGMAAGYFGRREPAHLTTARLGEMEAYFYLRSLGYGIVAKNFRSASDHGEIDLIGWDDGVLCFIEVKTHSHIGFVPPETAVDTAKRSHIRSVARRYVRQLRRDHPPSCRFDVVSVVLGDEGRSPVIRLHKGAFSWKPARFTEIGLEMNRKSGTTNNRRTS
jgi:putative endonuclease